MAKATGAGTARALMNIHRKVDDKQQVITRGEIFEGTAAEIADYIKRGWAAAVENQKVKKGAADGTEE